MCRYLRSVLSRARRRCQQEASATDAWQGRRTAVHPDVFKPRLQFNLQAISAVTKTDPIRPKLPVSYSRWPAPEPWGGRRGSPAGVPPHQLDLFLAIASRRRAELANQGGNEPIGSLTANRGRSRSSNPLFPAIRSVLIRPWIRDRRSTPQPSAHNPSPLDDPDYVVRLVALILRVAVCGNVVVLMPAFWP